MLRCAYCLAILFSLHSCISSSVDPDECKRFKTGKFILRSEDDNSTSIIERFDLIQIEKEGRTGNSVKTRIKWINYCTYELTFMDQSLTGPKAVDSFWQKIKVTTEIISTGPDFYIFKSHTVGLNSEPYIDSLKIYKD